MDNHDNTAIVMDFWSDMNNQSWNDLSRHFHDSAVINWHNTGEQFSVEEFILVNSKYPGDWIINIEKIFEIENIVMSIVKVVHNDADISFHANSLFEFNKSKITRLDEYWSEDSEPPKWRIEMNIGKSI